MKIKTAALLLLPLSAGIALAQGPLAPSGPPGPTMRSLAQVEPRIPISTPGTVISQPGSYYLTNSITVSAPGGIGIQITARDVQLDLGGFTISADSSVDVAGRQGIRVNPPEAANIVIRNGNIRGSKVFTASSVSGPGFDTGINVVPEQLDAWVAIENVRLSGVYTGITNPDGTVRNCEVTNAYTGIQADTVSECRVHVVATGINAAQVRDCDSTSRLTSAILGQSVTGCRGAAGAGAIFFPTISGKQVTNCRTRLLTGEPGGFIVGTTVTNCISPRIDAEIAIGCSAGPASSISHRYNMP
jgi:hypothetical protein